MQTGGKTQNEDYRLQTRGKMIKTTAGNTSALVEVRRNLLKSIIWSKCLHFFFRVLLGKFAY